VAHQTDPAVIIAVQIILFRYGTGIPVRRYCLHLPYITQEFPYDFENACGISAVMNVQIFLVIKVRKYKLFSN